MDKYRFRRRAVGILLIAGLTIALPFVVSASQTTTSGRPVLTPTDASAAGPTRIVVLRETTSSVTTSKTYQLVASTSMVHPGDQRGLVVAHFSAESLCQGAGGYCSVRIRMDGREMVPQSGRNFAFDSAGHDGRESHAMERTISGVSGGRVGIHVFAVEYTLVCHPTPTDCPTSFSLDDWVLDVQFWRQS